MPDLLLHEHVARAAPGVRGCARRGYRAPRVGHPPGGGEHRACGPVRPPLCRVPALHGGRSHVLGRAEDDGDGADGEHGEGRGGAERDDDATGAAAGVRAADAAADERGALAGCGLDRRDD